jgi:hypothetical protein
MKKAIVIIRFGSETPLSKEFPIISAASGKDVDKAVGCAFHNTGVISIIYSDWSPEKIVQAFAQVADLTGDILPVLAFELGAPTVAIDLNQVSSFAEMAKGFLESIESTQKEPAPKRVVELSLDELLDLVSQKGLSNLTADELARLKDLTK